MTAPKAVKAAQLARLDSIDPHPDNYNEGDVGAIMTMIAESGWWGTCIVRKHPDPSAGFVWQMLAGETRWRALSLLQAEGYHHPDTGETIAYADLPMTKQHGVMPPPGMIPVFHFAPADNDDAQAKIVLAADNRGPRLSRTDDEKLADVLSAIVAEGRSLLATGYDDDDLQALYAALDTEVRVAVQQTRTIGERADVYNNSAIRQLILVLTPEEFDRAHDILASARQHYSVDNHSEAAYAILTEWADE